MEEANTIDKMLLNQINGIVKDLEGEGDCSDIFEWLEDQLGIEQICFMPGTTEMLDFTVLCAAGGPHIEVNANAVEGWWGTAHYSRSYDDDLGLFDAIEELYGRE